MFCSYSRNTSQLTIHSLSIGYTFRRFVFAFQANPYVMEANNTAGFEGFCIDLMAAIAEKNDFKVEYHASPQNNYGTFSEEKGSSGMIKELMENVRKACLSRFSVDFHFQW